MTLEISVTILTKNSAKTLARTLGSLSHFSQVIVYDTGSSDKTLEIARQFSNVEVISGPFKGFGPTHNEASMLARHDWILSIDSDEWLSPELENEIASLKLDSHCVYSVRRRNFFQDTWIWSCGWSPDWQKKLYYRKVTQFSQAMVHESIESQGLSQVRLRGFLNHEPYRSIGDFLNKMQQYSSLFAQQSSKKVTPWTAIGHAFFTFFKSYILKRGILQGYKGWLISMYNAHCALYKYLKLYERGQRLKKSSPSHPGFEKK